ncbi:MAG: dockerin type I repeat-containing protein [Ruminococcus flavefaciens]|nr:dockerin type I repeat-containing protein [Ruminococcus flavefaciens]
MKKVNFQIVIYILMKLPLETKYEYIVAPDTVIGNWFENIKKSDYRFNEKYGVMLPLHTGYNFNYSTFESEDSHCYDICVLWSKNSYIKVVTDTDTSLGLDMKNEKQNDIFTQLKIQKVGADENGHIVYHLSSDTENILTEETAQKLVELRNEHLINLNYCEEYQLQNIPFSEYPIYKDNDIEKVSEYLNKHGINFSIVENLYNENMIVLDEQISAVEFYELISKIQEDIEIMPKIQINEVYSTKLISTEIYNSVQGDANSDGRFNIADIVNLNNFIIGRGTIGINADVNFDNIIDSFDMILMRKMILNNK